MIAVSDSRIAPIADSDIAPQTGHSVLNADDVLALSPGSDQPAHRKGPRTRLMPAIHK
jgi:hypothetical protein